MGYLISIKPSSRCSHKRWNEITAPRLGGDLAPTTSSPDA